MQGAKGWSLSARKQILNMISDRNLSENKCEISLYNSFVMHQTINLRLVDRDTMSELFEMNESSEPAADI